MENLRKTKIIFFGTPKFSLPSLEALLTNSYDIVAVITAPDEPVGRKQIITPPPVKVLAEKHSIPVFQPDSLKNSDLSKRLPPSDLFIVAAYGKIIPKDVLGLPRHGAMNIHPSLLPRWRGPSPIQYTILNGDETAGVSLIKVDEFVDHGPVITASCFQLLASGKPTFKELHDKLAKLGAKLLIDALPNYLNGQLIPTPQDDSKVTYSKILKKDDGRINWSRPAEEIERMVRAFNPWPGTWTMWPHDGKIYRIRIQEADFINEEPTQGSPGFIWLEKENLMLVKSGKGSVLIKKITIEGKNSMDSQSFLRGYPQIVETTFI